MCCDLKLVESSRVRAWNHTEHRGDIYWEMLPVSRGGLKQITQTRVGHVCLSVSLSVCLLLVALCPSRQISVIVECFFFWIEQVFSNAYSTSWSMTLHCDDGGV